MRPNSRRSAIPPPTVLQQASTTRLYYDRAFPPSEPPRLPQPERQPDANTPSPVAANPPILPPIPRVASQNDSDRPDLERARTLETRETGLQLSGNRNREPSPSSERKGIRPRGPSPKDGLQGISRSETTPEYSSIPERGSQKYGRPINSHVIAHSKVLTTNQRPPTDPIPKPTDISLPFPQPNRHPSRSPPPPKAPLHVRSQTIPPKQSKTKLNLLNPMSLLARRRSSQAVAEASRDKQYRSEDTNVPPLRMPDNYDPRIRGKVVHDFDSAPRSGRNGSYHECGTPPKSSNGQESQGVGQHTTRGLITEEDSPSSTEKEHTPVFKEHFDDGTDSWQEGREYGTKRPKSGFMYKVALQEPGPRPDPSSLPAFARNLPTSFLTNPQPVQRVASPPRAPLAVVLETALSESLPKDPSVISSPPISPPKARSRASSTTDPSFSPGGIPVRFKSNASRFSFALVGVGSVAQEQLLEEKHRQKAKEKARASAQSAKSIEQYNAESEDEDFGFDDDLSDDGLEEKIPGVNADCYDDILSSEGGVSTLGPLNPKTALIGVMSPVIEVLSSPDTPQFQQDKPDALQYPIPLSGFSHAQGTPSQDDSLVQSFRSPAELSDLSEAPRPHFGHDSRPLDAQLPQHRVDDYDDDDMYFDDGMIEDMDDDDGPAFDESLFDDESSKVYGVPIRDLPKPAQPTVKKDSPPTAVNGAGLSILPTDSDDVVGDDLLAEELRDSLPDLDQTNRPVFSQTAGLTQDNLAAYHDALAFAANQAALDGRFLRQQSLQSQKHYYSNGVNDDPEDGPIPVGESPSLEINGLPLSRNVPTNDDYDFDDALSDDPIIAAANAEALENDDDGFYGQEFGFFARANGTSEYANGGYFGQGVMRTHSGRNAEPALTPITERSEWSNRNSAINLALHGYSQVSLPQPSPGLAQLADMMHLEEDNMSLSALMKLRRGAWGSSTTSLQSNSGTSGSPLTYLPPMPSNATALQYQQQQQGNYPPVIMQQGMGASTYSLNSSNGDSSASDNSHTITLKTLPGITIPPNPAVNAPYMQPSYSNSGSDSSPVHSRPRSGLVPVKGKGHSRHGSSGDRESVSYVHERDEDGDRWVLEKRRVGEDGVVEVLGREVVEGGRI